MVVLDGTIVTIGNSQYLQPDYMSPLTTTVRALIILVELFEFF